ncbi:MAG: hypothetical protein KC656_26700, partial [Myxococcales bacterium]|nr:hypothetical protein [Myxococcales bacterium]
RPPHLTMGGYVREMVASARQRLGATAPATAHGYGHPSKSKILRNAIYSACLLLMMTVLSLQAEHIAHQALAGFAACHPSAWAHLHHAWNAHKLTFVIEAIGLVAFGIAWLVKARRIPGLDVGDAPIDDPDQLRGLWRWLYRLAWMNGAALFLTWVVLLTGATIAMHLWL